VEKPREVAALSTTAVVILLIIALIGLAEKGPPQLAVYMGASPLNDGGIGTMDLALALRGAGYRVVLIYNLTPYTERIQQIQSSSRLPDLSEVYRYAYIEEIPPSRRCLFAVISPEIPYTVWEAAVIVSNLVYKCGEVSILVADERATSNTLLSVLGSNLRLDGAVLLSDRGDPYPEAYITIPGASSYRLVLDVATFLRLEVNSSEIRSLEASSTGVLGYSTVEVDTSSETQFVVPYMASPIAEIPSLNLGLIGYVGPRSVLVQQLIRQNISGAQSAPYVVSQAYIPVAAIQRLTVNGRRVEVFVIGDGSVFLNQVLRSGIRSYRDFVFNLTGYLCGWSTDCTVIFDASRYPGADVASMSLEYAARFSVYQDPITIVLSQILKFVHPSTWLPPALRTLRDFFSGLSSAPLLAVAFVLGLTMVVYRYLSLQYPQLEADTRLREQEEVEIYLFSSLREAVLGGRIKLTKEDAAVLYRVVNDVLMSVAGVQLCSDESLRIISEALGSPKAAKRYRDSLCGLYQKISRGRRWPPTLFLVYRLRKLLAQSEAVLQRLGYTLMKERGVEYAYMVR